MGSVIFCLKNLLFFMDMPLSVTGSLRHRDKPTVDRP